MKSILTMTVGELRAQLARLPERMPVIGAPRHRAAIADDTDDTVYTIRVHVASNAAIIILDEPSL